MSGNELPEFLKVFLWSVDFKKLEKEKSRNYIIFQLLEFGNKEAIRWLFENYTVEKITDVLRTRRGFSKKSVNFWSLMLKIPKNEMLCSNQDWQQPRAKI